MHSSLLGTSGATFTFSVVGSLYMKQLLFFTIVGVTGKFRVNQIAAFAESFPTNFLIFISSSGCLDNPVVDYPSKLTTRKFTFVYSPSICTAAIRTSSYSYQAVSAAGN